MSQPLFVSAATPQPYERRTMSAVSRRTKWHPSPPPPPSPTVLRFPRRRTRTRRRKSQTRSNSLLLVNRNSLSSLKGNLQTLMLDRQPSLERRERVEEDEDEEEEECDGGGGLAEEKWRFQAEILRAECNLLRMERELALKKLKKNKIKMERTLRSAVQTLLSGRKKIAEGKNGNAALEEEIEGLVEKLDELQSNSRTKASSENGGCNNFDKKACLLQRRLENLGGLSHDELQSSCFPINTKESTTSDCRIDSKSSHEAVEQESKCSGRCKAMVLRIVEQVRAETEQWSQMQKMLEQVRGEMEELQASRDYWETRAHDSSCEIQSLRQDVEEWKEKALSYEKQVNKLELKLSLAKGKMQHKSKLDLRPVENNAVLDLPPVPLGAQLVKERLALQMNSNHAVGKLCRLEQDLMLEEMKLKENRKRTPKNESQPLSLAKQLAREKTSLIRGLKENGNRQELKEDGRSRRYSNIINGGVGSSRSPLRDIVNSSSLERQSHRSAFAYHSPESSRIRESFRK